MLDCCEGEGTPLALTTPRLMARARMIAMATMRATKRETTMICPQLRRLFGGEFPNMGCSSSSILIFLV